MLEFRKVNEEYGRIYHEGVQVGLYKDFKWSKEISIEINYAPQLVLPYSKKHLVRPTANRLYGMLKSRQRRTLLKEHKLRNSIYNR